MSTQEDQDVEPGMELDELRRAWRTLDLRLQRQNALQFALLQSEHVGRARSRLRPLLFGQCLSMLFGIALILLGVVTWRAHSGTPHLLLVGVLLHVAGVATAAAAAHVCALVMRIDHAVPVLELQRRLARLRRAHVLGGMLVGLPWWLLWIPAAMALAALAGIDLLAAAGGHTAGSWVMASLGVGVLGLAGTWLFHRWTQAPSRAALAARIAQAAAGESLRRAQAEIDALARYAEEAEEAA
jgi:hypothetical protein